MDAIKSASFPEDTATAVGLLREMVAGMTADLGYQNYEDEFSQMPGKYARPSGRFLLLECDGQAEGCIALRRVDDEICEMKRLFVRPRVRGGGRSRLLVERLMAEAREAGYREMRLDVLAELRAAKRLYESLGFEPAEPVSYNPLPGTSFLGLRLR